MTTCRSDGGVTTMDFGCGLFVGMIIGSIVTVLVIASLITASDGEDDEEE